MHIERQDSIPNIALMLDFHEVQWKASNTDVKVALYAGLHLCWADGIGHLALLDLVNLIHGVWLDSLLEGTHGGHGGLAGQQVHHDVANGVPRLHMCTLGLLPIELSALLDITSNARRRKQS